MTQRRRKPGETDRKSPLLAGFLVGEEGRGRIDYATHRGSGSGRLVDRNKILQFRLYLWIERDEPDSILICQARETRHPYDLPDTRNLDSTGKKEHE